MAAIGWWGRGPPERKRLVGVFGSLVSTFGKWLSLPAAKGESEDMKTEFSWAHVRGNGLLTADLVSEPFEVEPVAHRGQGAPEERTAAFGDKLLFPGLAAAPCVGSPSGRLIWVRVQLCNPGAMELGTLQHPSPVPFHTWMEEKPK